MSTFEAHNLKKKVDCHKRIFSMPAFDSQELTIKGGEIHTLRDMMNIK